MRIRLGNGPDSWGVWFPQDPDQVPWDRFLTEVADAGYRWIELGPYGYLPTDVARLKDELAMRDLHPVATFIEAPLEDPERAAEIEERVNQLGAWLATFGGRFLNVIDDAYRDLQTGQPVAPAVLSGASWRQLVGTLDRLGRLVRDRHGITLTVHPHVDTHIETTEQTEAMLADTDPEAVFVCLDTGHFAYRGGDPVDFYRKHRDRIPYLHIKNVDPKVLKVVDREDLPLVEAVKMEVFCEPDSGLLDFPDLRSALEEAAFDGYLMVEQDMYRPDHEVPLPIARRTREFLEGIGLGDT
jgi:inosose dehydratase